MDRIDTTLAVETPERVGFRYRLAGPGLRGLAWMVDVLVQVLAGGALGVAALVLGASLSELGGVGLGAAYLIWFAVSWLYGAVFETWWSGRTPGKVLLNLRTVKRDGAPIDVRDAVLRNLLRGVDGLPWFYVVGAGVALQDRALRRIGDLVADTVVVVETPTALLEPVVIEPPVSAEERRALPASVSLTTRERRAIESLLRRRRQLSSARVEELAGFLAPALSARTGVVGDSHVRTLALAYARALGREG